MLVYPHIHRIGSWLYSQEAKEWDFVLLRSHCSGSHPREDKTPCEMRRAGQLVHVELLLLGVTLEDRIEYTGKHEIQDQMDKEKRNKNSNEGDLMYKYTLNKEQPMNTNTTMVEA